MTTNQTKLPPEEELAAFAIESDKSIKLATDNGISIDMSEWLTLKRYAQRYGLASTNVVTNWISRGIIPAENVMDVPELNNLRLVKNMPYKDR